MKVFMINIVCGVKSTGRICTDLAQALEDTGHQCKVAYGRELVPVYLQKYAIKFGNKVTLKLDSVFTKLFDNAGFNSYTATKELIKQIKAFEPDIIHLHNLHGNYVNVKLLFRFLYLYGKPIIWTLHDCWAFTGHCAHFEVVGCEKWKSGCFNCPQKGAYPPSLFLDRSRRNYKIKRELFTSYDNLTIVTPSKWLSNNVRNSFLKNYRIEVINNGIDVGVFQPTDSAFREQYGLENKKIVLGVASPWNKKKGLYDFYQLAERLDGSYQVVLVGLSKDQIETAPKGVLGIERTNSVQELAEIYSAADVFVNLTYEDTYPTVNLEAQACGTPVITYRTGGSTESVPAEHVVAQGDLAGIIRKIEEGSLVVCASDVSKEAFVERYIALYKKLNNC